MKKRETELDLLRIVALLAVIAIHCTGIAPGSKILTLVAACVTWQVPVYVMISGRFFLDPQRRVSNSKIVKAIIRIIIAFVVWNFMYQIFYILSGAYSTLNWKGILMQAVLGPYHFWYLYMIIGLYVITPFLRKITENKRLMEYFIVLFILFQGVQYYGTNLPIIGGTIAEILDKFNVHFVLGFSGYYILGYYLYRYRIPQKKEVILYSIAVILLVVVGTLTVYRTLMEGVNNEWYTKYLMPNIVIVASAIYYLFVERIAKFSFNEKQVKLISKLSEYSFGVYLVHALFIDIMEGVLSKYSTINPVIIFTFMVMIVYALSNVAVGLIRKIPCIGKKIT